MTKYRSIVVIVAVVAGLGGVFRFQAGDGSRRAKTQETTMQSSNAERSRSADLDFTQRMIAQQRGAIDIAQAQLKEGKRPELRLAEEIIARREKEIGEMQGWLDRNRR